MDIRLDSEILTSDGETVGSVDSVIVNGDSHEVMGVIAREGMLFTTDRIIERQYMDRIDEDGTIHLSETSDEIDHFPEFVEAKYAHPENDQDAFIDDMALTYPIGRVYFAPTVMPGGGTDPTVTDPAYPAPDSPMQPADAHTPPLEVESNLPETDVMISEGTKVVDRSGDGIGNVDEVLYGDDNQVIGFIVKSGMIFKHDVRVPVDRVDEFTPDQIKLSCTAEEAESAGRM